MKFSEKVSQETPGNVVAGKCFDQNIFFKKYLIQFDIQWHVLPGIKCITRLKTFHDVHLGLFGPLLFVVYSSGQVTTSRALPRLHIQLFFLSKKFQEGG